MGAVFTYVIRLLFMFYPSINPYVLNAHITEQQYEEFSDKYECYWAPIDSFKVIELGPTVPPVHSCACPPKQGPVQRSNPLETIEYFYAP